MTLMKLQAYMETEAQSLYDLGMVAWAVGVSRAKAASRGQCTERERLPSTARMPGNLAFVPESRACVQDSIT